MSFVDLATLTMHKRNELECRINHFSEECEHAINEIRKLNARVRGFAQQLNCEREELKERFLNCMMQLNEYMYLINNFNLDLGKIEDTGSTESTPVHDTQIMVPLPAPVHCQNNLIDTLSEPTPSTSAACFNHCPPAKPKRAKIPKEDQMLIVFSSASSSSESVPQVKTGMVTKEVQCEMVAEMEAITLEASEPTEPCNLPAQTVLEVDLAYPATIMHIDGIYFWVITDNSQDVISVMSEMTDYYSNNHIDMSLENVKALTCCAFFDADSECYYRGLFLKLLEEDMNMAEVFAVDTGEIRTAPVECLQPLVPTFCVRPPFARCCHLAGVDLSTYNNKTLMEKQEAFLRQYVGNVCTIEVDDNTSESLGVYVILPSEEILNDIFVKQGLGLASKSYIFKNLSDNKGNERENGGEDDQENNCTETLVCGDVMKLSVNGSSSDISENQLNGNGENGDDVQENNRAETLERGDDIKLSMNGSSSNHSENQLNGNGENGDDTQEKNSDETLVDDDNLIVESSSSPLSENGENGGGDIQENNINETPVYDEKKLFVGGLTADTSEQNLRDHFSVYGEITSVYIRTGKVLRYAFTVFKSADSIDRVMAAGNHIVNNKKVNCQRAKARQLRVFVGGIYGEISHDEIKKFFSNFGTVVAVEKPVDKNRIPRKGFCFVTFQNEDEVTELLKTPKLTMAGKEIEVKPMISIPTPPAVVGKDTTGYSYQPGYNFGQNGYFYGLGGYGYNQGAYGYNQGAYGYNQGTYGYNQGAYGYNPVSYSYPAYPK